MDSTPETPVKRTLVQKIVVEVRSRPMGYGVMAAFVVAGPVATSWLFPEAPAGVGIIGGVAFGAYAALCAVPGKFI
ncbi:MAG: hypothetical protein JRG76_07950 [Deltaproteobacteria bacterium]|nr:hypothetical protein [Deltaproteobacteria bacterium]